MISRVVPAAQRRTAALGPWQQESPARRGCLEILSILAIKMNYQNVSG
jgi:hypothetical protein